MRKTILALIVILALAGCSNQTQTQELTESAVTNAQVDNPPEGEQPTASNEESQETQPAFGMQAEDEGKLPPVVDGVLIVPGQTTPFDYGGTLELKKIMEPKAVVMSGPLKITVESIKLFEVTDLPKDYHSSFSERSKTKVSSTMNYMQISYNMENTEDHDIEFFGLDKVVLNTGQQIERTNSFLNSEFGDSVFYGIVKQSDTLGLVYEGTADEIDSIRLIFGSVYDAEDKGIKTLSDIKKLNLNF
ncbi:hypothetical protein BK131_03245 [Paenibacillus amylolyticus]|uniref:Lipoprotein n=1 Tax=Paenibacillus amylolyticus TaxID=1451 RepID=A0A1R1C4P3_PAEAM|nr:hypothetical protein [Paenibacillus amylolyticus]OMF17007.1 hypothetical protein BK131_03245 [Paenibacillus amylolyticus]